MFLSLNRTKTQGKDTSEGNADAIKRLRDAHGSLITLIHLMNSSPGVVKYVIDCNNGVFATGAFTGGKVLC